MTDIWITKIFQKNTNDWLTNVGTLLHLSFHLKCPKILNYCKNIDDSFHEWLHIHEKSKSLNQHHFYRYKKSSFILRYLIQNPFWNLNFVQIFIRLAFTYRHLDRYSFLNNCPTEYKLASRFCQAFHSNYSLYYFKNTSLFHFIKFLYVHLVSKVYN